MGKTFGHEGTERRQLADNQTRAPLSFAEKKNIRTPLIYVVIESMYIPPTHNTT